MQKAPILNFFTLERILNWAVMVAIAAAVTFLYQTASSVDETNRNVAVLATKLINLNSAVEKQTLVVRQHVIDITAMQENVKSISKTDPEKMSYVNKQNSNTISALQEQVIVLQERLRVLTSDLKEVKKRIR
jgi:predicted  nucleic acid-binding Zn-ribbon protein